MTSTKSRIVLDESLRECIDAIQAKTRTPSPSAAIALLVSRYSRHLLETWELSATHHPDRNPADYYPEAKPVAPAKPDFVFTEPISGF